jgi:hypothetical protein
MLGYARKWHSSFEATLRVFHRSAASTAAAAAAADVAGDALVCADASQPWAIVCHSFAGDATNSAAWRGIKVHTLELWSAYIMSDDVVDVVGLVEAIRDNSNNFLGDLQKVEDGTGRGTVAMLKKQLSSIGCPLWGTQGELLENDCVLNIYAYTSDRGCDWRMRMRMMR